jgi:hypothetical protein
MRPYVFFSAFELLRDKPEMCNVCSSKPPVFNYELETWGENGKPEEQKGFCCSRCAVELLQELGRAESQKWAEEEAALEKDDFDVTDFRERRLAAFPNSARQ